MFIKVSDFKPTLAGWFLFILFSFSLSNIQAQPDGAKLFKDNCTSCHGIKDQVIGPALAGISQRRDEAWILKWVHNSQAVIKSGDKYGIDLAKKFNGTVMPNQNVTDDEIKAILAYVKAEESKVVAKAPGTTPGAETAASPEGISGFMLSMIVTILLILAIALGRVKKGLEYAIREKHDIPHPVKIPAKQARKNWIRANKKLIAVLLVVGFCVGSWKGWYALAGIGISQNYQPEQPIKFSHKLHAGDNKISCIYCHSGAEKSKQASIPALGTCMNCHKFIKEGPVYGDAEIKKIYTALDWDGTKYGKNQKPVQWVRVHALPDLAYFNHAQHVNAGKQQCQTCHGPVEEYDYDGMKQFAPLTMGWCVDCHRTTEVPGMTTNHYYDDFHKKLQAKYGKDAKLTVDKIGGIECARCHY